MYIFSSTLHFHEYVFLLIGVFRMIFSYYHNKLELNVYKTEL